MSQRIGLSVTSLLPEKRRPGAGGRPEYSSRSGRSEPWLPAPDRAQGWPRRLGLGLRGEAGREPGNSGQRRDFSSPPSSWPPVPASA